MVDFEYGVVNLLPDTENIKNMIFTKLFLDSNGSYELFINDNMLVQVSSLSDAFAYHLY